MRILNKQPPYYLQTDSKWSNFKYSNKDENTNLKESGCGPTAAAMLLSLITGKYITPVDTAKWALENGYKASHQGTYYTYFEPQFKKYGITCKMLNWENTYKKPNHNNHNLAKEEVKKGNYLICLMNKSQWTNGGHFIVVWNWDDLGVSINDPASMKESRLFSSQFTFCNAVKYYWVIYTDINKQTEEEKEMVYKNLESVPEWGRELIKECIDKGLIKGNDKKELYIPDSTLITLQILRNGGII